MTRGWLLGSSLPVGGWVRWVLRRYADSKSVADGQACERIDKNSRWMATRYAMVRWGIECGTVDLRLVSGEDNCADIFTKTLVGEAFERHRRTVLALE